MRHQRSGFFGVFGLRGGRRGGRHGRMRHARPAERIEHGLEFVEGRLGITDRQREAWEALAAMIRDGGEAFDAALAYPNNRLAPAPERLARLEGTVEAGLAILRRTRPPFEGLYAVLDDGQRRTLDRMMAKGGFRAARR